MSESNGCQKKNPYSDDYTRTYDPRRDSVIADLYDSGRWFQLPKEFLGIMSDTEAILLSYLINFSRYKKAKEKNEHWFYCVKMRICRDLHIPFQKQQRLLVSLKNRGFLLFKWKGQPAKRWMKIKYRRIHESVEALTKEEERITNSGIPVEQQDKEVLKLWAKSKTLMVPRYGKNHDDGNDG